MVVVDLQQRGPGGLLWRNKGIGSSDSAVIWYGKHFDRTILDLYHEKVGYVYSSEEQENINIKEQSAEHKKKVSAMNRGSELEPKARELYENLVGLKAPPLCAIHSEYSFIKGSFDGYYTTGKTSVILEIKCPNKYDHQGTLDGSVPDKYLPQLDHLLLVSDADFVHYVSYGSYLFKGTDKFAMVKYKRNQERIDDLLAKEINFWHNVQCRVPPT